MDLEFWLIHLVNFLGILVIVFGVAGLGAWLMLHAHDWKDEEDDDD